MYYLIFEDRFSIQTLPHISSVQRHWREPDAAQDLFESADHQDGVPRKRTCGISNRRHLFRSCKIFDDLM